MGGFCFYFGSHVFSKKFENFEESRNHRKGITGGGDLPHQCPVCLPPPSGCRSPQQLHRHILVCPDCRPCACACWKRATPNNSTSCPRTWGGVDPPQKGGVSSRHNNDSAVVWKGSAFEIFQIEFTGGFTRGGVLMGSEVDNNCFPLDVSIKYFWMLK